VNDWGDDDLDELSRGSRTSSELLDLVRAAEDEARMATRQAPPSSAAQVVEADELLPDEADQAAVEPAAAEEFVDVGEDAVDAPASHPTPAAELPAAGRAALLPALAPAPSAGGTMHPLVSIALVFVLAGAALALLAR
jgi:hypothetical protein